MKKTDRKLTIVFFIISLIIALAYIGFSTYLWVTYGGKPLNELPAWVIWFLWWR